VRAKPLLAGLGLALAAVGIGMLGAWAFNPDDGAVAHVEPLWRLFGITVYLGALAVPVLALTGLVVAAVHTVSACRRRHAL
jgi:formate hydrogenlyase subunit 3/multisubunit Na+/H+ antiporter MnhD subunit